MSAAECRPSGARPCKGCYRPAFGGLSALTGSAARPSCRQSFLTVICGRGCRGSLPAQRPCVSRGCFFLLRELRIEQSSALEHGAGDVEEPISDGPQSAGVPVTFGSEGLVFNLADGVVPNRGLRPVIGG